MTITDLQKEAEILFNEMLIANGGRCLKCSQYSAIAENKLQNHGWNKYLCSSCNMKAVEMTENKDGDVVVVVVNTPAAMNKAA
jgi:transposase-like protein